MDPEITEQLNEQLREMTDLLGQQNSALTTQLKMMQDQLAAEKNFTGAVNNNAKSVTNSVSRRALAEQEADKKLNDTRLKSANAFNNALSSSIGSLTSFGRALTSTEEGFKKYGGAVEGAGNALFSLGKNFGIIGTVLGGLAKGLTMFASQALQTHDTMITLNREVANFTGVIPVTNRNFATLAANAGYAGDKMIKFGKIISGLGTNTLALGDTAGQGAVKFAKVADVGNKVYESYSKLGKSQEDLTAMQAYYIREQSLSGRALSLRTKDESILRKESLAYVDNLIKMSALTGQNADDLQKEREAVKSEFEERVKVRQEELRAQAAERAGNKEEADRIRAESASRSAIIEKYTDMYGQEVGSMIGRVIRQGGFDQFTGGLAAAGIQVDELTSQMKASTSEQLAAQKKGASADELAAIRDKHAVNATEQYAAAQDRFVLMLGDAAQYSKDIGPAFGQTAEALGRSQNSIGKTAQERDAAAKKEIKDKKTANDADAAARAKQESADRSFQKKWQDEMLDLANLIMPQITNATNLATSSLEKLDQFIRHNLLPNMEGLKTALGMFAIIGTISVFKTLASSGKGLISIFGWLSNQIKVAFSWITTKLGTKFTGRNASDRSVLTGTTGKAAKTEASAAEKLAAEEAIKAERMNSARYFRKMGKSPKEAMRMARELHPAGSFKQFVSRSAAIEANAASAAEAGTSATRAASSTGKFGKAMSMFGKLTGAKTTEVAEAGEGVVKAAGAAGKLGKAMGILGKAAGPLAVVGAGLAGLSEWNAISQKKEKGEITEEESNSKKKEVVGSTTGGIIGGLGGAELGAAIGTVIAPGIGTVIGGVLGSFLGGSLGEGIGRSISTHFEKILDIATSPLFAIVSPLVAVGTIIKDNWDSLVSISKNLIGITVDLIKIAFFPIYWTGKKVAEGFEWLWKKAEPVTTKLIPLWDTLREGIKTGINWLSTFFGTIHSWTSKISSWLYGEDDSTKTDQEEKSEDSPKSEKNTNDLQNQSDQPIPAAPPVPLEQSMEQATNQPTQPIPAAPPVPTAKIQEQTRIHQIAMDKTTNSAETINEAANSSEKSSKLTQSSVTSFGNIVSSFGKIVSSEGKIIVAFAGISTRFNDAVKKFSDIITTFGDTSSMEGGSGSTQGATTGGVDQKDIQKSMNFLQSKGWSRAQSAGIVGNLVTESRLRPNAVGDNGQAYGIAQWHPDRQAKFKEKTGKDIRSATLEDQLGFLDWELRNTEKNAGDALSGASTASQAASIFDRKYERSSGAAIQERMANANAIDSGNTTGNTTDSSNLTSIGAQGKTTQVSSIAAPAFQSLLNYLTNYGYKIKSLGGYANRDVVGKPGVKSAHSRGWAIDINPETNALGSSKTDIPEEAINYARQMGLGWGGDWKSRKDPMHFSAQQNEGGWLKAEKGGIFTGPKTGYPMMMHGTEIVAPLTSGSKLMKMATTPAKSRNATKKPSIDSFVDKEFRSILRDVLSTIPETSSRNISKSDYPATLQGNEIVSPLDASSILAKIMKTLDTDDTKTSVNNFTNNNSTTTANTDRILEVQGKMIEILTKKLDTVIDVLETSHDTHSKILRHTAA